MDENGRPSSNTNANTNTKHSSFTSSKKNQQVQFVSAFACPSLPALISLNLSRNKLTALTGLNPAHLPSLTDLSLYSNLLTNSSLKPLDEFKSLLHLDIRLNPCTKFEHASSQVSFRRQRVTQHPLLMKLDGAVVRQKDRLALLGAIPDEDSDDSTKGDYSDYVSEEDDECNDNNTNNGDPSLPDQDDAQQVVINNGPSIDDINDLVHTALGDLTLTLTQTIASSTVNVPDLSDTIIEAVQQVVEGEVRKLLPLPEPVIPKAHNEMGCQTPSTTLFPDSIAARLESEKALAKDEHELLMSMVEEVKSTNDTLAANNAALVSTNSELLRSLAELRDQLARERKERELEVVQWQQNFTTVVKEAQSIARSAGEFVSRENLDNNRSDEGNVLVDVRKKLDGVASVWEKR
jgi:hypothetical protein